MKDSGWLRLRIFIMLACFFTFFGVIFGRAFQIQVLEGGSLRERARDQVTKTFKRPPRRGIIYDKHLNEMAVSVEVDSIYAHPKKVSDPVKAARVLSPIVEMSKREVLGKLKSRKSFVWIKRQVDLTDEQRRSVKDLGGIVSLKKGRRYYPNSHIAANLIGL